MAKSIGDVLKQIRQKQARLYRPNKKDDPLYVEYGEIMTCGDKWLIDCIDYNGEFAAQEGKCLVSVIQSAHEVVYVITEGKSYSGEFTGTIGAEFTTQVVPDDGYTAGKANPESGVIEEGLVVTVSPASIRNCTVSVVQSSNQTITVMVNGEELQEGTPITVPYGTPYTATVSPEPGYVAGTLNYPETGMINSDMEFSATEAVLKEYTVWIYNDSDTTPAEDLQHQVLTVYIPDKATGTGYTSSIEGVVGGTKYEIEVVPDQGYTAGWLYIDRTGVIVGDTTASAHPAYLPGTDLELKRINEFVIAKGPADDEWYVGTQGNIASGSITMSTADDDEESNYDNVTIRYVEATEITANHILLQVKFATIPSIYTKVKVSVNDGAYQSKIYSLQRDSYLDCTLSETIEVKSSDSAAYTALNNLFTNANHSSVENTCTIKFAFTNDTLDPPSVGP